MAESTLSVAYADLQSYVARFAGWSGSAGSWDSDQVADFALILKNGLRKFYYPPPVGEDPRYEWEFLKPVGTQVLVIGQAEYAMPDNFSGVIVEDSVTYAAATQHQKLRRVPEHAIAALRGKVSANSGTPAYYCVRVKDHVPATGMRWEMVLYPTPDDTHTIRYRYVILPDTLSTGQYPLGGASHSQTIIEALLSAAEEYLDDDPSGVHHQRFMELLGGSIRLDKETKGD